MAHYFRFVTVALIALALCVPVQAQTPGIDALGARAEQGDAEAQVRLPVCYAGGVGGSQDITDVQSVIWVTASA